MIMRVVHIKLNTERMVELRQMYAQVIIKELEHTAGCLYAGLLQSTTTPEDGISLTLWTSAIHAASYEASGLFTRLLEQAKPYFPQSPDWTVHLSEDFRIEYTPVDDSPVVRTYGEFPGVDPSAFVAPPRTPLFLRIVSLRVRQGMLDEFTSLYTGVILPALRVVPGCRHAHLTGRNDDPNAMISVTIWDSRADAQQYEVSGAFKALTDKLQHTLSGSTPWTMGTADRARLSVASDDMAVTGYTLIAGKSFHETD